MDDRAGWGNVYFYVKIRLIENIEVEFDTPPSNLVILASRYESNFLPIMVWDYNTTNPNEIFENNFEFNISQTFRYLKLKLYNKSSVAINILFSKVISF
jgi:hypothetical protein